MMGRYKYHWLLWIGLSLYSFTSYLILLKDHFILERLSLSLSTPEIETFGIELSGFLKVNHSSTVLIVISLLISCWAWFKLITSKEKTFKWKWTFLFVMTLFVSFPSLSTDVFDYNNANRVAFIHLANPWEYTANSFPNDSEIYFGSWIDRGSVYPPITFVFSSFVYFIFGAKTLFAVIGFKLLAIIFYLLTVITLINQKITDSRLIIFAYNPLILVEFIGNGHNDLILGFFLLLSFIYLVKYKSFLWSGIFMGLGVMSKISLLLYVPFMLWKVTFKEPITNVLKWATTFATTILIIGGLFLSSIEYFYLNLLDQFGIYQKSLPTVLYHLKLEPKLITLPVFSLVSLILIKKSKSFYIADFLILVMMFYLFIQAPMLQPWYLVWFLPLVSFVKSKKVFYTSIIFCISAMATYPVYFISLFQNPLEITWQLVLALTMTLPPIISLLIPAQWYTRNIDTL